MRRAWVMSQGGSLHPAQQLCSNPGVSPPPCSNNRLSNSTAPTCFAWGDRRCWSCTCSNETTAAVARWRVFSRFLLPSRWILPHAGARVDCREHACRGVLTGKKNFLLKGFCRVQKFNGGDIWNSTIGEVYGCLEKGWILKAKTQRLNRISKSESKKKNNPNLPEGNSRLC